MAHSGLAVELHRHQFCTAGLNVKDDPLDCHPPSWPFGTCGYYLSTFNTPPSAPQQLLRCIPRRLVSFLTAVQGGRHPLPRQRTHPWYPLLAEAHPCCVRCVGSSCTALGCSRNEQVLAQEHNGSAPRQPAPVPAHLATSISLVHLSKRDATLKELKEHEKDRGVLRSFDGRQDDERFGLHPIRFELTPHVSPDDMYKLGLAYYREMKPAPYFHSLSHLKSGLMIDGCAYLKAHCLA